MTTKQDRTSATHTVLRLSGGDLGPEQMFVRCDLSQAAAPVEVDYCTDRGEVSWQGTQFRCADARHTVEGLAEIARRIAAQANEMPDATFHCIVEEF